MGGPLKSPMISAVFNVPKGGPENGDPKRNVTLQ